jgi:hypothetical protein
MYIMNSLWLECNLKLDMTMHSQSSYFQVLLLVQFLWTLVKWRTTAFLINYLNRHRLFKLASSGIIHDLQIEPLWRIDSMDFIFVPICARSQYHTVSKSVIYKEWRQCDLWIRANPIRQFLERVSPFRFMKAIRCFVISDVLFTQILDPFVL